MPGHPEAMKISYCRGYFHSSAREELLCELRHYAVLGSLRSAALEDTLLGSSLRSAAKEIDEEIDEEIGFGQKRWAASMPSLATRSFLTHCQASRPGDDTLNGGAHLNYESIW